MAFRSVTVILLVPGTMNKVLAALKNPDTPVLSFLTPLQLDPVTITQTMWQPGGTVLPSCSWEILSMALPWMSGL